MAKSEDIILKGTAKGIAFDKAFADALKKAPPLNGDITRQFRLLEFYVEKSGVISTPISYVKLECTNIKIDCKT